MSSEASSSESNTNHAEFDSEVKWPEINQMLARRSRFDIQKLPHLPAELWLLIFQLATEVPFAFLPKTESPFDLPPRPTHKEMTAAFSFSLITKRYLVLVCKAWNEIATPLLYSAVLLRTTRGVTAAWETFRHSAQIDEGVGLGHYVKRIDLSMRDSLISHKCEHEKDAERKKIVEILQLLPNLSIFTMHPRFRGRDATCIGEALANTSAGTLQMIEWGKGYTFRHICLSGASWTRLVSSCPHLKSLEGPACKVFSTVLHPAAQLSHLSVVYEEREVEDVPPHPPTPLHIRYDSVENWDVTHPNTRAYCSRVISLDVGFWDQHTLNQLLAQCPKLCQLVLRIPDWSPMPKLSLDSSITHLGFFVENKQPRLPLLVKGLRRLVRWDIPGVETLRLMSRHPLLEGKNPENRRIRAVLGTIWEAGLVLENWEGKPFI